ncbi:hypothetical protein [Palleronia caenipelagi]|uniref:Uncharacterized protein n=1 Tax=Palleronia caenipelagi TaxID=2489174 RepID=A0A547Q5H7_9RHOB|nr:hypothetical protein [Palleronia caenipelagi]TRD21646.1 hypothetical protein FEV53_07845 [Palleronia caenipelagi]
MKLILPLLAAATIAACMPSQDACIRDATRDLRTVDELIAQQELILQRGYALKKEKEYVRRLSLCSGIGSWGHRRYGGVGTACVDSFPVTRTVPEAVNLDEVRATLASLREKRGELAAQAEPNVAACRARPA